MGGCRKPSRCSLLPGQAVRPLTRQLQLLGQLCPGGQQWPGRLHPVLTDGPDPSYFNLNTPEHPPASLLSPVSICLPLDPSLVDPLRMQTRPSHHISPSLHCWAYRDRLSIPWLLRREDRKTGSTLSSLTPPVNAVSLSVQGQQKGKHRQGA